MTIKKISRKKKEECTEANQDLLTDAFIKSGGKTSQESEKNSDTNTLDFRLTLRIPAKMIKKIDDTRKNRVGVFSRNSWILEAIEEKLNSK